MARKVTKENSLVINYPDIAKQWHPTLNGDKKPEDYSYGSGEKVWWLCEKKHKDYSPIVDRVRSRNSKFKGCAYCRGLKVSKENSLVINYPDIAKQWHPTLNGDKKPGDYTFGSNAKVWWLCDKGHDFDSHIVDRTKKNTGCDTCSNQTSKPEIRIYSELQYIFKEVKFHHTIKNFSVDIYIPNYKIAIEYDGSFYHGNYYKNKEEYDLKKNKFIESQNINLIRIRHKPLKKLRSHDIICDNEQPTKKDINKLCDTIILYIKNKRIEKIVKNYIKENLFQNNNLYKKYLSFYPSPIPELALSNTHPQIAKEWDYKKNDPLKPENFTYGSQEKVYWLCPKNHSYDAIINNRCKKTKPSGCPVCSGKKVTIENNLEENFPDIAALWHPTLNGNIKPTEVMPGSQKKYWWYCSVNDQAYSMPPGAKTNKSKPQKCPFCNGGKVGKKNNLAYVFPEVAKEWHPTKNGKKKPQHYRPKSHEEVWWLCSRKHTYKKRISVRTRKSSLKSKTRGCPDCYIKWKKMGMPKTF